MEKKTSSAKGWYGTALEQTTGRVADLCLSGEVSKTLKVLGGQRQPTVVLATVVLCALGWTEPPEVPSPFVLLSYCEILLP